MARFEVFAGVQPYEEQQSPPSPVDERNIPSELQLALARTRTPSVNKGSKSPTSPSATLHRQLSLSGDPNSPPPAWKRRPSINTARNGPPNTTRTSYHTSDSGHSTTTTPNGLSPQQLSPAQYQQQSPTLQYQQQQFQSQSQTLPQPPNRRQPPPNLAMTRAGVAQRMLRDDGPVAPPRSRGGLPPPSFRGRRQGTLSNRSSMLSMEGMGTMNSEELWALDDDTPDMSNPMRPSQERPLDTVRRMSQLYDIPVAPLPENLWPSAPPTAEYMAPPKNKSMTSLTGMRKRHTLRKTASRATSIADTHNSPSLMPIKSKDGLSSAHSSSTDLSIPLNKSQASLGNSRPGSMAYGFDLLSALAPREGGYAIAAQIGHNNQQFSPTSSQHSYDDRRSYVGPPPPHGNRSRAPSARSSGMGMRWSGEGGDFANGDMPLPGRISTATTSSNLSAMAAEEQQYQQQQQQQQQQYQQGEGSSSPPVMPAVAQLATPNAPSPLSQHTTAADVSGPQTPMHERAQYSFANGGPSATAPDTAAGAATGAAAGAAAATAAAAASKPKSKKELKAEEKAEKAKAKEAKLEAKRLAEKQQRDKLEAAKQAAEAKAKAKADAKAEAARKEKEEKERIKAEKKAKKASKMFKPAPAAAASARPSPSPKPSGEAASAPASAPVANGVPNGAGLPNGVPSGASTPNGHGLPNGSTNDGKSGRGPAIAAATAAATATAAGAAALAGRSTPPPQQAQAQDRSLPSPPRGSSMQARPSLLPFSQQPQPQQAPSATQEGQYAARPSLLAKSSASTLPRANGSATPSTGAATPSGPEPAATPSPAPSSYKETKTNASTPRSASSTSISSDHTARRKTSMLGSLKKRFSVVPDAAPPLPGKPRPVSMAPQSSSSPAPAPVAATPPPIPAPVVIPPRQSSAINIPPRQSSAHLAAAYKDAAAPIAQVVPEHERESEPVPELAPAPAPSAAPSAAPAPAAPVIVPPRGSSLAIPSSTPPILSQSPDESADYHRAPYASNASSVVVTPTTSMATTSQPSLFDLKPSAPFRDRSDSVTSGAGSDEVYPGVGVGVEEKTMPGGLPVAAH